MRLSTLIARSLVSTPFAVAAAPAAAQVPLCEGLKIVTAVSQNNGDYESIKTIESVDAEQILISYSSEHVDSGFFGTGELLKTHVIRRVLTEDLATATQYQQIFVGDADEIIPGTTAIGGSAAVLDALKSTGKSPFSISVIPGATPLRGSRDVRPNAYDYMQAGTIELVGVVQIPVIVNDAPVALTAIHARGEINFEQSEFFFLDDARNPMTLRMRLGVGAYKPMDAVNAELCAAMEASGTPDFSNLCLKEPRDRDTLQVIKIDYDCAVDVRDGGGGPPPPGSPPPGGGLGLPEGGGGAGGSGAGGAAGGAGGGGEGSGDGPGDGSGGSGEGGGAGAGGSPSALEQALEETGRADVYSIYFSFDSDAIREESEDTLAEIAELLRRHPDWRLSINGHTDNVASDSYNLDLSRRRAAATVAALTSRYGIDAGRLTSSGAGESSPVDTNETLEGRARNRRVELVRLP